MRVRDLMTQHPVCCRSEDTVHRVAQILRDHNIGSVPVIAADDSRRLLGLITDRDLCCRALASGVDPKTTSIEAYITRDVVTCRPQQSVDSCLKLMQVHQIRRVLVVDQEDHCVGIFSQADLVRCGESDKVHQTVAEISKPSQTIITTPAAA